MRFFVIFCQLNSAAALLAKALTPPSSGPLSPSRQLPRMSIVRGCIAKHREVGAKRLCDLKGRKKDRVRAPDLHEMGSLRQTASIINQTTAL
jgi:hypothetical protein